jgi:hypothetical protein
MRPGTRNSIIIAAGIATAIITAFLTVGLDDLLDRYFYSLMAGYIPAGAILVGAASASGFAMSAFYLNYMPTKPLFYLMGLFSCLSLLFIYFISYKTSVTSDGTPISQSYGFFAFMNILLSNTQIQASTDIHDIPLDATIEAGKAGYLLAVIQLLGFFFGGYAAFFFLKEIPVCKSCRLYLRTAGRRVKFFADGASLQHYRDRLSELPMTSPEFKQALSQPIGSPEMFKNLGVLRLNHELRRCGNCGCQLIKDFVSIRTKEDAKRIGALSRSTEIPPGLDLRGVFSGEEKANAEIGGTV